MKEDFFFFLLQKSTVYSMPNCKITTKFLLQPTERDGHFHSVTSGKWVELLLKNVVVSMVLQKDVG